MARDLHNIYNKLLSRYGDLHWWPASSPYEVIVGAVLTQNTAWSNVEKAIDNFGDSLSPEFIASLDMDALAELIRPSGFFNQKAASLKEITRWFEKYGYSVEKVKRHPLEKIRKELLAVKGVGKETADSILLYAFDYPTFVVDAYTKRLFERLSVDVKLDYDSIKSYFESCLEPNVKLYNNLHAMIVINAKEHCRKKPFCSGCPLAEGCVQPESRLKLIRLS